MTDFKEKWKILNDGNHIGEGGQSLVYLVARKDDPYEEKYVAKVLKKSKKTTPQRIEHFKREHDTINKLSHEYIVKLIDFNIDNVLLMFCKP